MARRMFVAGNWKMHKTVGEALELASELRRSLERVRDVDIAVGPPYTALHPVGKRLLDSRIGLLAQEAFYEDQGAFTGAISAPLLKDVGCSYALVGHSERRQLFGETLETSRLRVQAVLRAGLTPILCVGETLAERERNETNAIVGAQLEAGLHGVTGEQLPQLVVAYEPVWAIGTGKVATPQQAQDVHAMIRQRLRAHDAQAAEAVRILYGGSVKPDNARELLAQPDIDGALVGGASLDAASFAGIVNAARA